MTSPNRSVRLEVHDPATLAAAEKVLAACRGPREMAREVVAAVERNAQWRGRQCLNLLAPEAPTSPTVRALLSAEIGTRAAEGHIGAVNRWFAGTRHIDEVEALCMELLKRALGADYADHRLCASMIGNLAVYTALTQPGDTIMSAPQPMGGHSSNRLDGPAGVRGLKVVDIPFTPELEVDLAAFRLRAEQARPRLVALGMSMTLFPLPCREIADIIAPWGGQLFFDGAHQLGLIATGPLTHAVFPVLAATHQVNRVAALAVSAAEMLAFGSVYMAQIVKNAQALGRSLEQRGIPVVGSARGYTRTHQVIADARAFGGGLDAAQRLAQANLITNKNLIPGDRPEQWDRPSGLRIGTIEVTRLGMREEHMDAIAGFIARVLVEREPVERVMADVVDFRTPFQQLYYCFETGLPEYK